MGKEERLAEAARFYSEPIETLTESSSGCCGCKTQSTDLKFFATSLVIRESNRCGCCTEESTDTTVTPKFRIKDVDIATRGICCGSIPLDNLMSCGHMCNFCDCIKFRCVAPKETTVVFKLKSNPEEGFWGAMGSTIEVKVANDIREDVVLHYVYGPLIKTGDSTHALSHIVAEGLAKPAKVMMDMDRL